VEAEARMNHRTPLLVAGSRRRATKASGHSWVRGRAATGGREHPLDVVVLDVSLRQGLVAVQHLGRSGRVVGAVECASTKPVPAFASSWCSARATVPDRETQPGQMVDALLELIRARSVRAIIPVHDGTIEAVKVRRAEIERECAVALAAPAALDAAIDKERTLQAASDLGIRIPRCVRVSAEADVKAAVAEIGLPAVAKPTRSWVINGGDPQRLSPIAVISLEESRAAVAALRAVGSDVLFQEWIPGAREAVSFVYANGRYWGEFAQVARRMVPILGGNSVARESICLPPDAADVARRLVAELELEGYAEVEFRRDASGVPVLMEINPRLSASVEVAVRAGVNFPRLIYDWVTGAKLDRPSGYRPGVRMRWLGGDLRWLVDSVRSQDRPDALPVGKVLWDFARDFTRPAGYDYIARDDLRPAAIATFGAMRSARKMVAKRLGRRTREI
jgi:predicted ATP-grasp superfamily ATP-dependent carboligase